MGKDMDVASEVRPSLFQSIGLGIRVIFCEMHWNVIRALRQWEIKELEKRLDRKYSEFGRLIYREKALDAEEKKAVDALKEEIGFLEEEIRHLREELFRLREDIIRKRQENLVS